MGLLATEIQNVCSILYKLNLFEKHKHYKKNASTKQFYFTFRFKILSKSMHWVKSLKCSIYTYIYVYIKKIDKNSSDILVS